MRTDIVVRSPGPLRRGSYIVDHGPVRRAGRAVVRGSGKAAVGAARRGYRHRVRLAPLYLAVALWVAAFALHLSSSGWKTAFIPIALAALVGVFYGRHRNREGRRLPQRHRLYLWGCWAAGSTWLVTAAVLGAATMPLPGVLLAGTVTAAVPYWWHRRIRPHVEEDPDYVEPEIEAWYEKVQPSDGVLAGVELTRFTRLGNGWESPLQFTNHKVGIEEAFNSLTTLSRIYDVPLPNVVVRGSDDGRPSRGHITVLERNPLSAPRLWTGPTLNAEGVCRLGSHPDDRDALYQFWQLGSGGIHDLISGCTGSGKSRLVDLLLAEERHTPLITSMVIDPQGGQSLPDWRSAVAEFATSAAEGLDLLEYAVDIMRTRNEQLADREWVDDKGRTRRGQAFFNPTPEMPLVSITIEEAQAVFAQNGVAPTAARAVRAAEALAGMARKCGLKLRLVTQLPLLPQLGNSMYLRGQVAAGNVIVLRTAERLTQQVAFNGALPGADPSLLPRKWPDGSTTAGLGYSLGASSHQAMMRVDRLDDPYDWASSGELTRLDAASIPAKRERLELVSGQSDAVPVQDAVPVDTSLPVRDRILQYMTGQSRPVRTNTVAVAIGATPGAVSNTMKTLTSEGLVTSLGRGEWALRQAS